jgi:IS4 transposase
VRCWTRLVRWWRGSITISGSDFYRRHWDIEVLFKQVKQTLKLSNFLGHSANAVRLQVYTALLVYVLLRFRGFLSAWAHSLTRLFAVVRSAVW